MAFRCCAPVSKATDPARRSTRALTARERAIYQAFLDAAANLQAGVDSATTRRLIAQGIEAAMGSLDTGGFVSALSPMVDAIQAQVAAGGTAAMSELTRLTGVSGVLRFDVLDPRALAWAETQAGRLIRQVTDEQRDILRRILARSVENGWTVAQTTQDLRQVVGLHDRWATAVLNAKDRELERLIKTGMSDDLARQKADVFADRYRQRLVQARAKNIARTEILTASNQGRYLSWAQGVEQGHIAPNATKEWSTGPLVTRSPGRIQVCELCQGVRGEQRRWDEEFSIGVMMPPGHPACRCTAVLVPVSIEEIRRRLREADGKPAVQTPAAQATPAQAPIERVPGKGTPTGQPWDADVPQFNSATEAEAWLQQRWGTTYTGSSRSIKLGDIDTNAAQLIAQDTDYLFKKYPSVADRIEKFGSAQANGYPVGSWNGIAGRSQRMLYYNESIYKGDNWTAKFIRNKENGWFSSAYPIRTVHHEFGHWMHYVAEHAGHGSLDARYSMLLPNEEHLREGLSPLLKQILGLKGRPGLSGAVTKTAVGPALSNYGTTNWAEFCAEAFAESMLADMNAGKVRPLAAAVREWLDEQVAKVPLPG